MRLLTRRRTTLNESPFEGRCLTEPLMQCAKLLNWCCLFTKLIDILLAFVGVVTMGLVFYWQPERRNRFHCSVIEVFSSETYLRNDGKRNTKELFYDIKKQCNLNWVFTLKKEQGLNLSSVFSVIEHVKRTIVLWHWNAMWVERSVYAFANLKERKGLDLFSQGCQWWTKKNPNDILL